MTLTKEQEEEFMKEVNAKEQTPEEWAELEAWSKEIGVPILTIPKTYVTTCGLTLKLGGLMQLSNNKSHLFYYPLGATGLVEIGDKDINLKSQYQPFQKHTKQREN